MNLPTKVAVVAALGVSVFFVLASKGQRQLQPPQREVSADSSKPLPRLLELGSSKCTPCKAMKPILASLEQKHQGKLRVEFIDVWEDLRAGEKYNVESIPTQILFDASGKEVFRHEGFYPQDELEKRMREVGFDL